MWKSDNVSRTWLTSNSSTGVSNHLQEGNFSTSFPLHSPNNTSPEVNASEASVTSFSFLNCVPPSISEFPDDFFSEEQRLQGGILVHALIVAYVCAMLAIVCDRYFVPSLRVISNYFNVPADIAGATFMAIGTSSPELFSSVIGAFVAKGDIGLGTVVGSAVFNILAVTGAGGLALGTFAAQLEWYPITRDCLIYVITVASLVIVIHDNIVTWMEATTLLSMFFGYLLLLYFNRNLQKTSSKMVKSVENWWNTDRYYDIRKMKTSLLKESAPLIRGNHKRPSHYHSHDDSACPSSESSSILIESSENETVVNCESSCPAVKQDSTKKIDCDSLSTSSATSRSTFDDIHAFEMSAEFSLYQLPPSKIQKVAWVLMWPANLLFQLTIPNCTAEGKLMWFPLTFFSSVMWLGILSYVSFWMVAIIGFTFGIPDTVSGITILAAGTSVPELVASVIVVKSGLSNMAISNLIGSNIFDILFCLGLPWLVKTLLNTETQSMVINSSALTYTTLMLLFAVILFYVALLFCRWRLSWRVGVISLSLYAIFLVVASLYESNFFGDFNPPSCPIS